jgi:hypothetical protein
MISQMPRINVETVLAGNQQLMENEERELAVKFDVSVTNTNEIIDIPTERNRTRRKPK